MPGPVLDDLSRESIALAGGVPVVSADRRGRAGSGSPSTSSRRPGRRGPRRCSSCRPPTRPGPSTRRRRSRPSAAGPLEHGLWVVTDEIYEHLVYGGAEHHSMPVVVPELADRCLVVNGVAKTYAMTGWRVGWLIGPADVIAAATNLQCHETSNVANVSQRAALAAVSAATSTTWPMMRAGLRPAPPDHRPMLNEIDGVDLRRARGGLLRLPGRGPARAARFGGRSARRPALELAELAINEAKVAVVPGEAFGAPGLLPHVLRPGRRRPGRRGRPGWPSCFGRSARGVTWRARDRQAGIARKDHRGPSPRHREDRPERPATCWPTPATRSTSSWA